MFGPFTQSPVLACKHCQHSSFPAWCSHAERVSLNSFARRCCLQAQRNRSLQCCHPIGCSSVGLAPRVLSLSRPGVGGPRGSAVHTSGVSSDSHSQWRRGLWRLHPDCQPQPRWPSRGLRHQVGSSCPQAPTPEPVELFSFCIKPLV